MNKNIIFFLLEIFFSYWNLVLVILMMKCKFKNKMILLKLNEIIKLNNYSKYNLYKNNCGIFPQNIIYKIIIYIKIIK